MSHKHNPPRQNVHRGRKAVGVHLEASVGTATTMQPKTSILDKTNGESSNGARPVETEA
jgi:hypothetical protein